MNVKYFIRYFDVIGIEHKLDIFDISSEQIATAYKNRVENDGGVIDDFNCLVSELDKVISEQPIQVDGRITLTNSETDDSLEAIRGQGLSVELEADTNMTFSDLWGEEEKTYKVIYYRDGVVLFQGWLNPEGFFEDYVNTNWKITFDCVDGLGYLKDLSFVDDATGFPITGRKTYLEILSLALQRTGLQLNIYTSIDIRYTGLLSTLDVLDNVYANTERYIKDDGETIMSCDEVIRDILEPFGAVLTSFKGIWYIYKPNQLYSNSTATFYPYTYKGVRFNELLAVTDFSLTIGNESEGFSPHHCSANQSIINKSSVGAYRISYKYGLVKSLTGNPSLFSPNGANIDGWDVISNTNLEPLVAGGTGVIFNNVGVSSSIENLRTKDIEIADADISIDVIIKFETSGAFLGPLGGVRFNYQIIFADDIITNPGVNKYYLNSDLTWGIVNTPNTLRFGTRDSSALINLTTPPKPPAITGSGFFYVSIWTPEEIVVTTQQTTLTEVRLAPNQGQGSTLEGEFHTFQRTTKPSSKVENVKEVATGDNVTDIYEGTIYKTDAETPTETWSRKNLSEDKPLLQIMGEETLRINQKQSRVFSGDLYGFFDYLSVVTIDGLEGVYMPIKYSYDTKNNIISSEFKQIYGDELIDIDYKKTFDYGNTVKPTII